MKLLQLSLITCTILLSFACCKRNTEKSTSPNAVTQTGTPSDITSPPPGPKETTGIETANTNKDMQDTTANANRTADPNSYGFVVSFFSPGGGIDSNTKDAYDKFLEGYKSKVEAEQYRWGREGEIDYCLKLSKLSAGEKKDFIAKSRAILEKSDRVHIYENSPCVHKK